RLRRRSRVPGRRLAARALPAPAGAAHVLEDRRPRRPARGLRHRVARDDRPAQSRARALQREPPGPGGRPRRPRGSGARRPYAPGIVVTRGRLVFLSGVTAAAVYHSHPHRDEEFDLPSTMREQAVLTMENLKKTLEAAGCGLRDLVSATRFLTDVSEQDDLNRVWADYLKGHLPTTTTVEV